MPTRQHIKDHIRESRLFNERAAAAVLITLVLFACITVRLVYLQILNHEHFVTLAEGNRISLVPTPPMRGFIYDRNGVLLADDIPSFSLELIPEQIHDLADTIARLRELINISDDDVKRFYRQLRQKRSFMSIPLRLNLSDLEMARLAVNRYRFPGVETEPRVIRRYPLGPLAVHAIGYVGRISEEELQTVDDANYTATDFIGKVGIEKFYESNLHGTVGYRQVETNAYGRAIRELSSVPSVPGQNIYLTLDSGLQQVAEQQLEGRRGAVVAVDPTNGEVLAFVSMPTFDPNLFVTGIDADTYSALQNSPDNPLYNRASRGQYPPGSTIKPFVGLAGLENEAVKINTESFCPGWFSLPGDSHRYRDWKEKGHGTMTLESAIVESCDVYFYQLARAIGIDRLSGYLGQFGFGRLTGIDLPDERPGILPSRGWKRAVRRQVWFPGETLIMGIGQGYLLVTPLQLAHAVSTLAEHGKGFTPRLVQAIESPDGTSRTAFQAQPDPPITVRTAENWDDIIEAMRKVVSSPRGTAALAIGRDPEFDIAGKTGTAQVFGVKQSEKYSQLHVEERMRDHALFIAFAPVENPKIAVAVIVENAGHGSTAAAPVARKVIDYYLERHGS
jgi:penicillin-binding protein 2